MKLTKNLFYTAACGVAMLAMSASANAQYTGTGWLVSNATAGSATLANATAQAGNTNKVTFTASGLNFSSFGNASNTGNGSLDYTVGSFLSSQGSVTGTPSYSGSVTSGTSLSPGGNGFLFEFTGTAFFTHGQTFTLAHDDGVDLYVGGTEVLNASGPTAPVTTTFTYNGTTGNQSFTFVYGECCGAPAVFQTTLVPATATPEPGSIGLLASALVGAGLLLRKRKAA